jgi:heme exporter protein C
MLWPLLVMAIGASALFLTLHFMALRNEILRRRIARLTRQSVRAGEVDELEAAE